MKRGNGRGGGGEVSYLNRRSSSAADMLDVMVSRML